MALVDDLLDELEHKMSHQFRKMQELVKENDELKSEIKELKLALSSSKKEIKTLENKNKEIKVASGLAGNSEHRRLMKHKLNNLIKEVDLCIAEVKKKSF